MQIFPQDPYGQDFKYRDITNKIIKSDVGYAYPSINLTIPLKV